MDTYKNKKEPSETSPPINKYPTPPGQSVKRDHANDQVREVDEKSYALDEQTLFTQENL